MFTVRYGLNALYMDQVCLQSRHPLITATQVRPRAIPSRICGARSYFSSISVFPRQYRSIIVPHSPSTSKEPLSEGLSAKPGGLSNEMNFSLISAKAQQSTVTALFAYKTTVFAAPLATYQRAHRPTICMWLSKFRTCTISSQNCAGRQQ